MVETTVKKIDRKYGVDIPAVEGGGPCVTVAPIVEGACRVPRGHVVECEHVFIVRVSFIASS
jgi:hypothetical protein